MSTIVVTGADETFAPLLIDLVDSLNATEPGLFDAIGILDVGLSEASRERLSSKVAFIVEPGWDFEIDPALRLAKPHLRAILSRPFIPKYFPGFTRYLWMDADTWVQEGYALKWLARAAVNDTMALVPHVDRSYNSHPSIADWETSRRGSYFPGSLPPGYISFNAGVFCIEGNAPHWSSWAHYMKIALDNSPTTVSDQTVLNYALAMDKLRVHRLPALCNWCCHLAIPRVLNGRLIEPYLPHTAIGIVHLSGLRNKNIAIKYMEGDKQMERSLRYGAVPSVVTG